MLVKERKISTRFAGLATVIVQQQTEANHIGLFFPFSPLFCWSRGFYLILKIFPEDMNPQQGQLE